MEKNSSALVVLASFNPSRFVKEQVSSIMEGSDIKIKIYDDGSQKAALENLKAYCQPYKRRISIIERNKNLGVIENFRLAISDNEKYSRIYLSDQDDIWRSDKFQVIEKQLKGKKQPTLVYHDSKMINENGRIIHPSFWSFLNQDHYQHRLETFLFGNFVTGSSCAFNNELIPFIVRLPKGLTTLHDAWIGLCSFVFGNVIKVNEPLNFYRNHSDNVALTVAQKRTWIEGQFHFIKLMKNNTFLEPELELVGAFLETFKEEIPINKLKILTEFYHLREKSAIYRRVFRKKVLSKYSAWSTLG